MSKHDENLWQGIDRGARGSLNTRDYRAGSFAQELAERGLDASELVAADRSQREIKDAWIPGVEIFARTVYPQRHRGFFGEFVRRDEGILARIDLWPKQWSAARLFAGTAKGFHVHPPSIPENSDPVDWLRRLYIDEPDNYSARSYDNEQWDVMFFVQGRVASRSGASSGAPGARTRGSRSARYARCFRRHRGCGDLPRGANLRRRKRLWDPRR